MNHEFSSQPGSDHLTAEQMAQLAVATRQSKKLRGAVGFASFNAWTLACGAGLCAILAPFSWVNAILAVVLGAITYVEFSGRRMLRAFDDRGPVVLAFNQVGLFFVITVYCLWALYEAKVHPPEDIQVLNQLGPQYAGLYDTLASAFYISVMAGSLILQSAAAIYYLTRRRAIRKYVQDTPEWVLEVQRIQAGG